MDYVTLAEIIDVIRLAKRNKRREVKIAVSLSGGGARGVYEAGVAEALLRAFLEAGIAPDIITGTSAGALVGTGLFLDLSLPSSLRSIIQQPYSGNQSWLWRKVCDQNEGSELIAGERAWVIKYYSGKVALPVARSFQEARDELQRSSDQLTEITERIRNRTDALARRCEGELQSKFNDARASFARVSETLNKLTDIFNTDLNKLAADLRTLQDSILDPVQAVIALERVNEDMIKILINPITLSLAPEMEQLIRELPKDLQRQIDGPLKILGAVLESVIQDIRELMSLSPSLKDILEDFKSVLNELLLWDRFVNMILTEDEDGTLVLNDHAIENEGIKSLIRDLIRQTWGDRPAPPGTIFEREIVEDWVRRRLQSEPVPELLLTGANLTSSRLTVFSVASPETVTALARGGIWTVDLTDTVNLSEGVLRPVLGAGSEPLVEAAMTSASIPCVFPPVAWDLERVVERRGVTKLHHLFADGGILNGSPIDLAVKSGATHVISIEMSPLLTNSWKGLTWPEDDRRRRNYASVGMDSLSTALDGALLASINTLVEDNRNRRPPVELFRIAPLKPNVDRDGRSVSIGVVDFDGLYDENHKLLMSMYDWFIQGYIDAKGLTAADWTSDSIVLDYLDAIASSTRGYVKDSAKPSGNKFWRATERSLPSEPP